MPLHIVRVRLEFSGFGTRASRPTSSASKGTLFVLPSRPEFVLCAINLSNEDFSGEKLWVRELPYRQRCKFGQPFGHLVPDDATQTDNVPGEIFVTYIRRYADMHDHTWIFCPYLAVQLH